MKNNKKAWIFMFVVIAFAGGWIFGNAYTRRSVNNNTQDVQNEVLMTSRRQIDSINNQAKMDKELIIRLAAKIDSLRHPSKSQTRLVAMNKTPIPTPKKPSANGVFLAEDDELDFFNSYIENETDIDF
jgi:hypothetical protein